MLFSRKWFKVSCLGAMVLLATVSARAADFYAGKQVTLVVSSDVGNTYDLTGRIIARHLPRFIPGAPNIVVQNMPGAGGIRAMNWLYNVAPKDGLTLGLVNNTLAFNPLYGDKLAQFDAQKFNWLGTPNKDNSLFIVWHAVPVKTIEEARNRELVLAATGAGSTPAFWARVAAAIFDLKVRIIPGYKSQGESFMAMERGENDGNAAPFWAALNSDFPGWIEQGKIRALVYYGATRDPEIPAPFAMDLITDPAKRSLLEVAQAGIAMGRPVLAPPGVEPAKVQVLRDAMNAMFKDPEYLRECTQVARLKCDTAWSGEEIAKFIAATYASPKDAVEKISEIFAQGQTP